MDQRVQESSLPALPPPEIRAMITENGSLGVRLDVWIDCGALSSPKIYWIWSWSTDTLGRHFKHAMEAIT